MEDLTVPVMHPIVAGLLQSANALEGIGAPLQKKLRDAADLIVAMLKDQENMDHRYTGVTLAIGGHLTAQQIDETTVVNPSTREHMHCALAGYNAIQELKALRGAIVYPATSEAPTTDGQG